MTSRVDSDSLCETIIQLIREGNTEATPVISVVSDNSAVDIRACDVSDRINDDELDDLVEEQLVLNKIKEMQNARLNLGINRLQVNKSNFNQNTTTQDRNDDDNDSLFNFTPTGNSNDDRKHKEDLERLSKALTVNILMQSELHKLEIFLTEKLKRNQQEQLELKNETSEILANSDKVSSVKSISFYSKFGIPYFKDERKFTCSYNPDYRNMKSLNQTLSSNVIVTKMWSLKEKSLLEEGVKRLLVEENIAELLAQEEKLKQDLECSDSRKTIQNIKHDISLIKSKIKLIKEKSLSSLFSKCSDDREFDWLSVSIENVVAHTALECQTMWHLYVKPTVNKAEWTPREDNRLLKLVGKYNKENWDMIAKDLETSRTGYQCFVNYQTRLNKDMKKLGKWTEEEDRALSTLIAKCRVGRFIPWTKIAYYFEGRSLAQIYCRWNSSLNPDLKKGRFTRHEDKMIVSFVRKFGEDFSKISKLIGDRTSVQLRERYSRAVPVKYQNVGRWSLDEDKLLLSLVKKHGVANWSAVSKQFVTRTRTQVRHRYSAIKKTLDKNPNTVLEDFPRGPTAQMKSVLPQVATNIEKEPKKNMLVDLIERNRVEETLFKRQNNMLMSRIKTGRKKISKRCELDTKLINYFREAYTNEKVQLKTQYLKPDNDKALNAIALFFQFLQAHITLPDKDSAVYKRLPLTLRNIIKVMQERFTNWGCDCLVTSPSCQSHFCFCKEQNSIDCFPVDLKTTIVDDSDYLLCSVLDLNKPNDINKQACKCFNKEVKHFISHYLPPNIITSIGFRSVLLIKDKISNSLSYDRKRSGYFPRDNVEIQNKGLKTFTGYFSEEVDGDCEEENDCASDFKRKSNNDKLTESEVDKSMLSTPCSSNSLPSSSTVSLKKLSCEPSSLNLYDTTLESKESLKRLTAQEAINLWKERLMAVLGWPIVLSNEAPNSSNLNSNEESKTPKNPSEDDGLGRDEPCTSSNISENLLLEEIDLRNPKVVAEKPVPTDNNRGVKRKYEEIKDRLLNDKSDKVLSDVFMNYKRAVNNKRSNKLNDENNDPTFNVSVNAAQCSVEIAVGSTLVKEQSQGMLNLKPNQNTDKANDIPSTHVVMDKVHRCYTRKKVRNDN